MGQPCPRCCRERQNWFNASEGQGLGPWEGRSLIDGDHPQTLSGCVSETRGGLLGTELSRSGRRGDTVPLCWTQSVVRTLSSSHSLAFRLFSQVYSRLLLPVYLSRLSLHFGCLVVLWTSCQILFSELICPIAAVGPQVPEQVLHACACTRTRTLTAGEDWALAPCSSGVVLRILTHISVLHSKIPLPGPSL